MKTIAEYLCLGCGHRWAATIEGGPLPLKHPHSTECPRCGHLLFKWLNYSPLTPSSKE